MKKLVAVIAATAVALTVGATTMASAHDGKGGKDGKVAGKSFMHKNKAEINAVITSTLGISLDTLKSRMKAGESLATIAGDKKAVLIAAISAEVNKQIDAALASGKLTAAQATAQKANTTERVTYMVEKIKSMRSKAFKGGFRA